MDSILVLRSITNEFVLWDFFKDRVYHTKRAAVEELKLVINLNVAKINVNTLRNA